MANTEHTEQIEPPEVETTPERPEWLPQQYADEAAYVKAMDEKDKLYGRQTEELGQLRGEVEALTAALTEQQQHVQQTTHQTEYDRLAAAYGNAMDQGDYAQALALQGHLTQLQTQAAIEAAMSKLPPPPEQDLGAVLEHAERNLRDRYGDDFDRLYNKTAEVYGNSPQLLPDRSKPVTVAEVQRGVEMAFLLAQRDEYAGTLEAQRKEQEAAAASARAKEQAQTMTGSGPRLAPKSEQERVLDELRSHSNTGFRPSATR